MIQTALLFETIEDVYLRVFRELKPRTRAPEVAVKFYPYANADSTIQLDDDRRRLTVKISDQLEGAPAPVQEALAHILLRKLYKKPIPRKYNYRYRLYLNRTDIRRKALLIRQIRGRKQILSAQGRVYDLDELFDDLNAQFFGGLLAKPQLSWSPGKSRNTLGHFDPAHNAIIISRVFDHPKIPRFLVEYIVYHEMLHLKFPVEYNRSRRRVHTKDFQRNERAFQRYTEAVELIKQL